jgi:hypothetical protein
MLLVPIEVICQFAVKFLSGEIVFRANTRTPKLLARNGLVQSTRSWALTSMRMLPAFWATAAWWEQKSAATATSAETILFMELFSGNTFTIGLNSAMRRLTISAPPLGRRFRQFAVFKIGGTFYKGSR